MKGIEGVKYMFNLCALHVRDDMIKEISYTCTDSSRSSFHTYSGEWKSDNGYVTLRAFLGEITLRADYHENIIREEMYKVKDSVRISKSILNESGLRKTFYPVMGTMTRILTPQERNIKVKIDEYLNNDALELTREKFKNNDIYTFIQIHRKLKLNNVELHYWKERAIIARKIVMKIATFEGTKNKDELIRIMKKHIISNYQSKLFTNQLLLLEPNDTSLSADIDDLNIINNNIFIILCKK